MAAEHARRAYVYGIATVAALSGLLFGFDTAVINGALVFLKDQMRLSDFQTELAASALLVGCLAGAAMAGGLSDRLGRKKVLMLAAVLFCVSSLGTALPRTLPEFVAARFFAGVAIGVASALAPLYIAEVSPPGIRGRLVTLNQMAIVTGILCAYLVNWLLAGLGPSSWRWMFAAAAFPSAVFLVSLFFIPESPRWLIKNEREAEALSVLRRIAGEPEAAREAAEIRASLTEQAAALGELFKPGLRRALLIAVALAIFSQVTGINTVIYYGSILFKEHGGSSSAASAIGANVIIGTMNFLCTIVAIAAIDRFGRKPLLIVGSAGMGLALAALGACFLVSPPPTNLILLLVVLYVGFFAISLGPVTWVYMAELFPTKIRGRAAGIGTFAVWSACLLVTLTFLTLISAVGPSGAFWTYAFFCLVTFIFVWRVAPETKGRSLEEIERLWHPRR